MTMKDIDAKIGMPDVNAEWDKFAHEVIGQDQVPESLSVGMKRQGSLWLLRAASIALICGLAAVGYAFYSIYSVQAVAQEADMTISEVASLESAMEAEGNILMFDDVEMQSIAVALSEHYQIPVCYESEEAKHVRLYVSIDLNQSLDEVVDFLNNLQGVHLSVTDGTLLIR